MPAFLCSAQGAKGVVNFSENIRFGYFPKESSIEYEGLFYDYYFETVGSTDKLFHPSFSFITSKDPFNGAKEYYMSIGLSSCHDGKGLYQYGGRPNLNLMIVLDISGSMGDSFQGEGESKSKLEIAKESILTLMSKLRPEDRFGIVLFDTEATVLQEMTPWGELNVSNLKESIMSLSQRGGTILSVGMVGAVNQYHKLLEQGQEDGTYHENRILFLTDMMANERDSDTIKLVEQVTENASDKFRIYSTFIGVGIDFDTSVVSKLTSIRATNYMSVKSAREFKKQMDEEFDYLASPNVYECSVDINKPEELSFEVERVFGSPGYEVTKQGRLMYIDSSFPSLKEDNMTKGGIILVKLNKKETTTVNNKITLSVNYKDRHMKEYHDEYTISIPFEDEPEVQNLSARKAVLLVRYTNFMKHFLRSAQNNFDEPPISMETGITVPEVVKSLDQATSTARPLSEKWKALFESFIQHFESGMVAIQDATLDKELQQLIKIKDTTEPEPSPRTITPLHPILPHHPGRMIYYA